MIFDLPQGEDEEGLIIKSKVKTAVSDGPLPSFMNYSQSSNQLGIFPTKSKDLGIYDLIMCLSDDYAKPTCATFKVTVSEPKIKIAKMNLV